MKPRPKITWTNPSAVPPVKKAPRRPRPSGIVRVANEPWFYLEPPMNDATRVAWDEINQGSPITFVIEATIVQSKGFPLPLLKKAKLTPIFTAGAPVTYAALPGSDQLPQGTFAVYLGMTTVKMKRSTGSSHVEGNVVDRAFRTILVGQNKYLLDDPNMIRTV